MEDKVFTGVRDTDREILSRLSGGDLFRACRLNNYAKKICNETFWRSKFIQTFGTDLGPYISPNVRYEDLYADLYYSSPQTLLLEAVENNYVPLFEVLLPKLTPPLNSPHYFKFIRNLYVIAAANDSLDIIKYLISLERKANPKFNPSKDLDLKEALNTAIYYNSKNTFKYLIDEIEHLNHLRRMISERH